MTELEFCPVCGRPNIDHPTRRVAVGGRELVMNDCRPRRREEQFPRRRAPLPWGTARNIRCFWDGCTEMFTSVRAYARHLASHGREPERQP